MTKRSPFPTGPVPEAWHSEAVGMDLRRALVILTQDVISQAVEETDVSVLHAKNRPRRVEPGLRMPNGRHPTLMPMVNEQWWKMSDIHTPALLGKLIRGELFAFGDPEVTGAHPVWIAPRQWRQLRFDPLDIGQKVSGGGATFWNVRVLDPGKVGLGASKTGSRNAPAVGSKRGPKGNLTARLAARMVAELQAGQIRINTVDEEGQEAFASRYGAARSTVMDAWRLALSEFNSNN